MSDGPDYPALVAGHTDVIKMVNAGETGLPVLGRLLEVAEAALGAQGMSFVEFGPVAGRVIAATGASGWALGRPVKRDHPTIARLIGGPPCWELPTAALTDELSAQLTGRGLHRMVGARVVVGGLLVGSLQAFYPDVDGRASPEVLQVLTFLAVNAAHLYGDQAGLPVHGDGPVVAALSEGLAIVDRRLTVRLWNPAAEKIIGRPVADMIGELMPIPVPPAGQVVDHQLPDGRWLKIASGQLPGTADSRVVTFRDATEQHRHDHDRELFIAITSHELRTPVTVIKGYADTLTNHWESLDESARREAVRVLGQRADDLARLVDRLLSATTDAGPVSSGPVPFDLAGGLRAAIGALPGELRRRIALAVAPGLPKALGDRASLPTVLTELVTNADKYSPPGSPIEVVADADPRTVCVRVADRGVGVRPEHVERAFERFWQGDSGDRRRYPGAGLGLYLVRQVVERQNGWVSLRPREGGGTVAEVRLPRGDVSFSGGA